MATKVSIAGTKMNRRAACIPIPAQPVDSSSCSPYGLWLSADDAGRAPASRRRPDGDARTRRADVGATFRLDIPVRHSVKRFCRQGFLSIVWTIDPHSHSRVLSRPVPTRLNARLCIPGAGIVAHGSDWYMSSRGRHNY